MTSHTRHLHGLLAALVMVVLLPVVSPRVGAATGAANTFEPAACWFSIPAGYTEGEDVVCGYVTVPERHADPDGRTIRLAVAVIKNTGDHPAPDPLVIESGGPGMPSLSAVPSLLGLDLFRETRDMVIVDQRGTGESDPSLVCTLGDRVMREMYGTNPSLDDIAAAEESVLRSCRAYWRARGVDLSAYNSVESAADFPLVMEALGYETYNFYGISYASALAQHLMRDAPDRLRSVVLDAVVPLPVDFTETSPSTTMRAFNRLFDQCAADPACDAQFPDLETIFFDLVAQYDAAPLTVTLDNPWGGKRVEAVVTGTDLVMALYQQLYGTAAIPLLPASIYALADGDLHFVEQYVTPSRFGGLRMTSGMSDSVMCSEFASSSDFTRQIDGVEPAVTEALLTYMDYRYVCALWDVEPLPAETREPVSSDIPTLLLSGEYDPITPPENAALVAEGLSHSYAYTFPGVGHGAMGSGTCGLSIVLDFVNDPAHAPDTSCLEVERVKFALSLDASADITLEPVTVTASGIRTVKPQGWTELEPGLYGGPGYTSLIGFYEMPDWDTARNTFGTEQPSGSVDMGDLLWTAYGVELPGYVGTVMMASAPGGGVYVAGLLTQSTDDLVALTDSALLPALNAFEPVG